MPNETPQTLPPDFFNKKKAKTAAPATLPANFFDTKKSELDAPDPTKPDPSAVAKPAEMKSSWEFGNYSVLPPKAEGQRRMAAGNTNEQMREHAIEASTITGSLIGGEMIAPAKGLLPIIMRALGVGTGAAIGNVAVSGDPKRAIKTGTTYGIAEGTGELAVKGAGKILEKVLPKIPSLAKINKLLGVGEADVIPGKTPSSLDEFTANPARGASKYGLDEKSLAKMNPLERNKAVMAARDKAGQALEATLKQASDEGRVVNVQDAVQGVFKKISDKKVSVSVQKKFLDIMAQNGIRKPISQLTPMEARSIQRGLDNFADFASTDTVESMKQAATALRKEISKATRKVVPESAPFDQDYTDLFHASQGTQKLVKDYATKVPENKLRKYIIKTAIGGTVAGAGYEAAKIWGNTTPVP